MAGGTVEMEGCVSAGGRLGGIAADGPDEGARFTAAPGSGTEAGGIGGGWSEKNCAWAEAAKNHDSANAKANVKASASHDWPPRRHLVMPSPPVFILMLFTENAANSSLRLCETPEEEPVRCRRIGQIDRASVILVVQ
jgi:hypothetical protein